MAMRPFIIWKPTWQRWMSKKGPLDPRYVFSRPPNSTNRNDGNNRQDGTHFFTDPCQDDGDSSDKNRAKSLGEAIMKQRRRKSIKTAYSVFWISIVGVLGYSIGYRVMYKKEQSFLPLMPASRTHKLSDYEARRIDADKVKDLTRIRVLEQLSQHEMIKEQYGVPLLNVSTHETPNVDEFTIWCEDAEPCITGLVVEPDDNIITRDNNWYRLPYFFKWRLTRRPINIRKTINEISQYLGLTLSDFFQVMKPEEASGSLKYEYPLPGDNDTFTKVRFLGEMKLNDESLIIYKGKFHIDAKLDQIHLLRRENGKLIRYILYKDE